jgi:hypothetical protein
MLCLSILLSRGLTYRSDSCSADFVLTTFPARHDIHNTHTLAEEIQAKVTMARGGADMTPDKLVGKVLEACSEYEPLLCDGRSYLAAFGQEIAALVDSPPFFLFFLL